MGKSSAVLARGVYAALITPRRASSIEADAAGFFDYMDRVSAAGVDGLVLFGSTGEFVHYDIEDRVRVVGLAAKRSRLPVLVNVSHSSLAGAVVLAQQALDAGVAGLLLMPPYFFHYGDQEIEQFYLDFLTAAGRELPVYVYHLPAFTSPLSLTLMTRLLRSGLFAGIKDSSGTWDSMDSLLALRRELDFQLLAGNESLYIRCLEGGADGIVSGVSAALPELTVSIRRAFESGDTAASDRLHGRLTEFMAWVEQFPPTVAIKFALESRAWVQADLAVPLGLGTSANVTAFKDWLKAWIPETLAECAALSGGVRS